MASAGGFDHNAHSIRLVTKLEAPYPGFDGLNLSWEALEGLAKHNGPIPKPTWALSEANAAFDLELHRWPSLEAQVAAVADDIAYDNHDIDDGLRAGLLDLDELIEIPIVRRHWDEIDRRHPGSLHRQEIASAGARPDRHDGWRSDHGNPGEDRRNGGRQPGRRPLGGQAARRILLSAVGGGKGAQALPLRAPLQCG